MPNTCRLHTQNPASLTNLKPLLKTTKKSFKTTKTFSKKIKPNTSLRLSTKIQAINLISFFTGEKNVKLNSIKCSWIIRLRNPSGLSSVQRRSMPKKLPTDKPARTCSVILHQTKLNLKFCSRIRIPQNLTFWKFRNNFKVCKRNLRNWARRLTIKVHPKR